MLIITRYATWFIVKEYKNVKYTIKRSLRTPVVIIALFLCRYGKARCQVHKLELYSI